MKPEGFYECSNLMDTSKIEPFSTTVVGMAKRFDSDRREIVVELGQDILGIIPEEESTTYQFTYPERGDIPYQISALIGTQVKAIVTKKISNNLLLLSRKITMQDAWDKLAENDEIFARVTKVYDCGMFVNVGDGLISYLNRFEYSVVRTNDLRKWAKVGDYVKVKIVDKGIDESSKIMISRKLTYPQMKDAINMMQTGDIIAVKIGNRTNKEGFFCEYAPGISGIIDTERKLQEGQVVKGYVKEISLRGIKLKEI